MSSLSVHLRRTEDHSGLPFHPSCPVCRRDRLAGSLDGDELVSRRMQAALAVGVLAFSAVGAPAAMATGPDVEVEGSAEVMEHTDSDSVELGDATIPLTDAGPAAPDDEATVDGLQAEEVADGDVMAGEPLTEAVAEPVEPVVTSPEPAGHPAPEPVPEPVTPAAPPDGVPPATGVAESGGSVQPRVDRAEWTKRERPRVERMRAPVERAGVAAPVRAPARTGGGGFAAPAQAPASVAPADMQVREPVAVRIVAGASSGARGGEASAGDRFHVVRRGESLWSIAADVLGERAGVGRIAREVNRLWALNEDRIASGSPDLLYAGTRLRLR